MFLDSSSNLKNLPQLSGILASNFMPIHMVLSKSLKHMPVELALTNYNPFNLKKQMYIPNITPINNV
jgi:hypothetical protein